MKFAKHGGFVWCPTLKYQSREALQKKIDEYFRICKDPPLIGELAVHLGLNRKRILEYGEDERFYDIIAAAKMKIEAGMERHLFGGKSVAGVIFCLCNNFGWKNPQHVDVSSSAPLKIEIVKYGP